MSTSHLAHAQSLCRFIDNSPSSFHVVASAIELLEAAGFKEFNAQGGAPGNEKHGSGPGRYFHQRDGSIFAWVVPEGVKESTPFRIVGAHTDSPNLRLKPQPFATSAGLGQLGVEVYGGVLLNSWLGRDLGISGRIAVRTGSSLEQRLVRIDDPLVHIPQLAIHLDREISTKGLLLNKQQHLSPVYEVDPTALLTRLYDEADCSPQDVLGSELMLHDTQPSRLIGLDEEFVSAPRIDNQLSCHAALTALSGIQGATSISMVALFDHEEVGSVSQSGAATAVLPRLLQGINRSVGGSDAMYAQACDNSLFVSVDNAHATHPNYPERHDPQHQVELNSGPVIKVNANQRYTTDAMSMGLVELAAERAGVETQRFVSRSDMACGSTIGPTVASLLGMRSADLGCAQLAMHSIRELAGSSDPWDLTLLLAALFD